MLRKVLTVSLYVLILFEGVLAFDLKDIAAKDTAKYLKNPIYNRRIELFKLYKIRKVDIVMLGNSLTEGVDWSELLGRFSVANRGITGDILEGYLNRMKYVYNLHPKVCFIEGGINDIYNWTPVKEIFEQYKKVIAILLQHNIIPVIQSTLYSAEFWGEKWILNHNPNLKPAEVNKGRNNEVKKLNSLLREYARKNGIIFIDMNKKMTSRGFLKRSLTWDGVHLTARGYKIWAEEVNKVLIKLGL